MCIHKIQHLFPKMGGDWTETATLPGGDMENADYDLFRNTLKAEFPFMNRGLREYYGRRYGTLTRDLAAGATSLEGLGRHFGGNLYEAEVNWLVTHEWAQTAEDILWRRTKHRLHMTEAQIAAFTDWFDAHKAEAA